MSERLPHITYAPDAAPGGALPTHESSERPLAGKVAVVTGGSRDIGARIVARLAGLGADTIVGYNNKAKRADAVAKEIAPFGTNSKFVGADITTPEGIQAIVDGIDRVSPETEDGQVDFVILNAASSTRELNVDANHNLIDAILPKMRKGGKIVYMQSSPGHFNHVLAPVGLIPDIYTGVAATKNEAEQTIAARVPELQEKGISLIRVIAPAIPDSSNVRMFKSRDAEAVGKFTEIANKLGIPTEMNMEELADYVVTLVQTTTSPDHIELFDPNLLDGRQTLKTIYGEEAMYVDVKDTETGKGRMIVTPDRAGKHHEIRMTYRGVYDSQVDGEIEIQDYHAAGHFTPESGLPLVLPGHKHLRIATETLGIVAGLGLPAQEADNWTMRLRGFDEVAFSRPIKPGELVSVAAEITGQHDNVYTANAVLKVGDQVKTQITGLIVERVHRELLQNAMQEDQLIEFAAQSAAMDIFVKQPDNRPLFGRIGPTRFTGKEISPGMSLTTTQHKVSEGKIFSAAAMITDQDDKFVAVIDDMQALIAKQAIVKRLIGS